jgi:F0F1-type ATP synthase membrane subunit b/b'
MLDINWTFFTQLGFFLALMVIVNLLIFRTMRAYLARRQRTIDNLKATAGGSESTLAEISAAYTRKIAAAREENLSCRADVRRQALAEQKAAIDEAKRQAILTVDSAEDDLAKEVAAARTHLQQETRSLAAAIAAKVLGRPFLNLEKN